MAVAFSEYFIEWYFFPSLKGNCYIYLFAFCVAVAGQAIRTTAMYTGGVSFHHMVQVRPNKLFYPLFAFSVLDLHAVVLETDSLCSSRNRHKIANRIKRPTTTSSSTLESMRTHTLTP